MESQDMKEAYEEIERLSQNPETQRLAEFRERELKDIRQREFEAREDGIELGIERGIEQGKINEKREIVIRMYGDGMPVESIVRYSEMSLERVLEIIKSIEQ